MKGTNKMATLEGIDISNKPSGLRTTIRKLVGVPWSCPIELVDGDKSPSYEGEEHYYVTPSGEYVRYPNAYRRAFGKPIYCHSTLRIEVGIDWLLSKGICPDAIYY